jgi:hypothetical protein
MGSDVPHKTECVDTAEETWWPEYEERGWSMMRKTKTTKLGDLCERAKLLEDAQDKLRDEANALLKGKKITVTNERWNGQPHGRSWPKLKGKTFEIDHCIFWDGEIEVWFDGPNHYCYMPISHGVVSP